MEAILGATTALILSLGFTEFRARRTEKITRAIKEEFVAYEKDVAMI